MFFSDFIDLLTFLITVLFFLTFASDEPIKTGSKGLFNVGGQRKSHLKWMERLPRNAHSSVSLPHQRSVQASNCWQQYPMKGPHKKILIELVDYGL